MSPYGPPTENGEVKHSCLTSRGKWEVLYGPEWTTFDSCESVWSGEVLVEGRRPFW